MTPEEELQQAYAQEELEAAYASEAEGASTPQYGESANDLGVGTTRQPASKFQQLMAKVKSKIPTSVDDAVTRAMQTPLTPTGALAKMLSPDTEKWMRENYLSPNLGGVIGPRGATSIVTKPVQIAANTIGLIPGMGKYTSAPVNDQLASMQEDWKEKVGSDPMGEMVGQSAALAVPGGAPLYSNMAPATGRMAGLVNTARPTVEASVRGAFAVPLQNPTARVNSPQEFFSELGDEAVMGAQFGAGMSAVPQAVGAAQGASAAALRKLLGVTKERSASALANQQLVNKLSGNLGVDAPELTVGQATGKKSWMESLGENMPMGIKPEIQNAQARELSDALGAKYQKGFEDQSFVNLKGGPNPGSLEAENLAQAAGDRDLTAKTSYRMGVGNKEKLEEPLWNKVAEGSEKAGPMSGPDLDFFIQDLDTHIDKLSSEVAPDFPLLKKLQQQRDRFASIGKNSVDPTADNVLKWVRKLKEEGEDLKVSQSAEDRTLYRDYMRPLIADVDQNLVNFADRKGFGDDLQTARASYRKNVVPSKFSRAGKALNKEDGPVENFIGLNTAPTKPIQSEFVSKVLEPKGRAAVRADKVLDYIKAGEVGETFLPGKVADKMKADADNLPIWFRRSQRKELEAYATTMKFLKDSAMTEASALQKVGRARAAKFGLMAMGGGAVTSGAIAAGPVGALGSAVGVFGTGPFSKWLLTSRQGKQFLLETSKYSAVPKQLKTLMEQRLPELMSMYQANLDSSTKLKKLLGANDDSQGQ